MPHYTDLLLIPLLPLASFIILSLMGRRFVTRYASAIGVLSLFLVTILALYTAAGYFSHAATTAALFQRVVPLQFTWLRFTAHIAIDIGLVKDPISMMMVVVISVVSLMVHLFSLGYMKGESRQGAYYAYLSLFTFAMLGLVLSVNLFQLYMFWELVGVSSYLLIGFYFEKPSAVAAAKKAFIVTRFADLGFLIGILLLAFNAETLDIGVLLTRLTDPQSSWFIAASTDSFLGVSAFTWALVLIFIGGAGKSAMFPLHIWLPDAMEGPTPVSALIHAATMVVAGVFLVARLFPIFSINETVMHLVAYTGVVSAVIAAIIACTQTDIKRVLAYSTMSQIGYMMFALGVARYDGEASLGYTASMFHLFTHAFFKSLLFLGAGAVIHLVHSNEMKDMGGLRKKMPVTHACFLLACLAIAGIPPLAGFFSKEAILTAAFQVNKFIYSIGLLVSGLTAFYMFRLYFSIFWSDKVQDGGILKNGAGASHHEGTLSMKLPMIVLAICTCLAGFVPIPHYITASGQPFENRIDMSLALIPPVALALIGIAVAWFFYGRKNNRPQQLRGVFNGLYQAAYRRFYIDDLYLFVTKKFLFNGIGRAAAWTDRHIVDGFMNELANATQKFARSVRSLQSGRLQVYLLYFFMGVAIFSIAAIYWWRI